MNIYALLNIINIPLVLALGIIVYMREPFNRLNKIFLSFMIGSAYTALCEFFRLASADSESAMIWHRASFLWPFFVGIMLLFVMELTENEKAKKSRFIIIIFLPAAVFSLLHIFTNVLYTGIYKSRFGWIPGISNNPAGSSVVLYFLICSLISVYFLVSRYRLKKNTVVRKKILYTLAGILIPTLNGVVSNSILPQWGYRLPPTDSIAFVIGGAFLAYGIYSNSLFPVNPLSTVSKIFSSIHEYLIIINDKREILQVSNSFLLCTGFTEKQVLHENINKYITQDSELDYLLDLRNVGRELEVNFKGRNNKVIPAAMVVSVIPGRREKEKFRLLIGRDLRERKYFEERSLSEEGDPEQKIDKRSSELLESYKLLEIEINERKVLEKILGESEERYHGLFKKNPNPMWIYDPKTLAFIDVNDASVTHYGYSKKEFLSMTLMNLYPDEDQSLMLENILSEDQGKQNSNTWRHKKKNGAIIYVSVIASEILIDGGKKVKLVLINDITEKKTVQETLDNERAQMLSIFGSIEEPIYVSDMDTYEILYANNAAKKIFGSNLVGETCYVVLQSKVAECEFCTNNIIRKMNYRPYLWEFHYSVPNRTYQIIDRVIKWTDGRDVRFELAIDTTASHEAEQILRESEERYRALVNKLPDFVMVLVEDTIVFINDITLKVSGYTSEELIGQSIFKFVMPASRPLVLDRIKSNPLRADAEDYEIDLFFKDGLERRVTFKSAAITYNKKDSTLVVMTDITDRKKSEARIKLLAHSVRSTGEGISISDLNSNLLFVNEAFINLYGYAESELLGQNISKVRPKDAKNPEIEKIVSETINGGWSGELINRKKDGTEFPIFLSTSPILDENGNPYALIGITRDITERKQAQAALEESEKRFRNVFEYSPLGIYRTTPDGKILLANPALVNMLKYPSEEELKKLDLNNSDYPRNEFLKRITSEGKIVGHETEWTRYDGTTIFVRENSKAILDENGNALYYEGTIEDITEQKKIADELQKHRFQLEELVEERTAKLRGSEEKFRALAENTHDIIMRMNTNLEHVYINPAFQKYSGVPAEQFIGKSIKDVGSPPSAVLEYERELLKVFETKELNKYEMQLPSGKWFDWAIIPEFDLMGNVVSIILNGRDITERINLEESFKNSLENEKLLSELKTKFISTASHEFRTPLTTILSSTELLERYGKKWSADKFGEQIDNIKNSVDYLTQLMTDVLSIGKTETGKEKPNLEKVDFNELCLNVIKEIIPLTTRKHKISFKKLAGQKYLFIDEKLMRFILMNLLTNAVKYSPAGGKIELQTEYSANELVVKISDEGMGISENDRKGLFEPFTRGSNSKNIPGTGLGLSIVKKSVDLLKGKIEVESEIHKGSIFTIFIPVESTDSN